MDFRATGGAEKDTYTSAEIQTELANYHATLMKVLNMLDSLVILHQIAKDDAADPMLREIFWYSTTNRAAHLTPFMDAVDRRRPFEGWHTLREVLRHPEMAGNNADTPKHN
jgi:radical SAM superfamily enzyme